MTFSLFGIKVLTDMAHESIVIKKRETEEARVKRCTDKESRKVRVRILIQAQDRASKMWLWLPNNSFTFELESGRVLLLRDKVEAALRVF